MEIPSKFTIANQEYTVKFVDSLEDSNYGEFDSIRAEIRLALNAKSPYDFNYYQLTEEQIKNTFWHELFHCFNWHMNTECDETIAQSFANFMREFETSKVMHEISSN